MKRFGMLASGLLLAAALFSGCSSVQGADQSGARSSFDQSQAINVVSREDGSGTRGAFIELVGVEVKGDDGSKKDMTTKEAVIANKTDVVMTSIATDTYGIGYISLGSLNDTVKAVDVEGVKASSENIKNGSYKISRPFIIATKDDTSQLADDFISYILSKEGQEIISNGYIAVDDSAPAFAGTNPTGKIVIAGSSSVTPIMEKLVEAYKEINTSAEIEIQLSDSSSGMTGAIEGTCDIGMASRELKDSELEALTPTVIAMDGIAVIVNQDNPAASLTTEQIRQIYTGEATAWDQVK